MSRSLLPAFVCVPLLVFGGACADESPPASNENGPDTVSQEAGAEDSPGRVFERSFTFIAFTRDSTILAPLLFHSRPAGDAVEREIQGWLAGDGSWENFVHERWRVGSDPAAWRIHPRGPVRLVVGEGDAIESILYREPPRVLELDFGADLGEWTGPRGGTYRIEESSLLLGTRQVEGLTLDLSRARPTGDPPGTDWAFLLSGDSVQVVLASPVEAEPGTDGAFVGFARHQLRQVQWPDVTVEWPERRAYEPARRNVPVVWRFESADGEIEGRLEVESAELETGEGDGPLLPVRAFFEVGGTVQIENTEYPVRGLVHHRRE